MKKHTVIIPVLSLLFLFYSCIFPTNSSSSTGVQYTFDITSGKNILTLTNGGARNTNINFSYHASRTAAEQQQIDSIFSNYTERLIKSVPSDKLVLKDTKAALEFNANPPFLPDTDARSVQGISALNSTVNRGDSKLFWVTNANDVFSQKSAVLQAQGSYCNIWVEESCFTNTNEPGKLNRTNIEELADTFDLIYPLATNLLGYENGGGLPANHSNYGGIDGDPRIQILVYNIAERDVAGYFWAKDQYTQSQLGKNNSTRNLRSNEAEIFYISAGFTLREPEIIYSTLIHEFQHMINFNQKVLTQSSALWESGETWYNEMLSLLAEDIIGPLIGILPKTEGESPAGHPIDERIPLFLAYYWYAGITDWLKEEVSISYSVAYAFGAYLIRNYGGPELLKAIMDNKRVNRTSITQALQSISGDPLVSFESALARYYEALLYSTTNTGNVTNKLTFDRTVTSKINGIDYTAYGFDIWNMQMPRYALADFNNTFNNPLDYKGPIILPLLKSYKSPGYSLCLFTIPDPEQDEWPGTLTVFLKSSSGLANIQLGHINLED